MRKLGLLVFLVLIASGVYASAEGSTFIVGTLYEGVYGSDGLNDATLEITCGDASWSGTSESDGSYAADFSSADCHSGSAVSVSISKSGYVSRTFTGKYDNTNLDSIGIVIDFSENLLVVNFVIKEEKISSGTGGGVSGCKSTFWDCESTWSVCNNGAQTRKCVSNCATSRTENQSCTVIETPVNLTVEEDSTPEEVNTPVIEDTETPRTGFFTGAVIGNLGAGSLALIGLVVVGLGGGLWFVMAKRKKAN